MQHSASLPGLRGGDGLIDRLVNAEHLGQPGDLEDPQDLRPGANQVERTVAGPRRRRPRRRPWRSGPASDPRILPRSAVFGQLERGAAQAAHDRAVLDLLGRELDAPGLGLARALGGHPPPAALLRRAGLAIALVLTATAAAGAARAGQVGQERQPGPSIPVATSA